MARAEPAAPRTAVWLPAAVCCLCAHPGPFPAVLADDGALLVFPAVCTSRDAVPCSPAGLLGCPALCRWLGDAVRGGPAAIVRYAPGPLAALLGRRPPGTPPPPGPLGLLQHALCDASPELAAERARADGLARIARACADSRLCLPVVLAPHLRWTGARVLLGALLLAAVLLWALGRRAALLEEGRCERRWTAAVDAAGAHLEAVLAWIVASAPGGPQLSAPFNRFLGTLYLGLAGLWGRMLVAGAPAVCSAAWLGPAVVLLLQGGVAGLLALCVDASVAFSFPLFCFRAYATRLCFRHHALMLRSVLLLYAGRKWNPLRRRVDTCDADRGRTVVGAVLGAFLLCLLPATLAYHVLFSLLWGAAVAVQGVLRHILQAWLLFPWRDVWLSLTTADGGSDALSLRLDAIVPECSVVVLSVVPEQPRSSPARIVLGALVLDASVGSLWRRVREAAASLVLLGGA